MTTTNYDTNQNLEETSRLLNENVQETWIERLRRPHLLWMIAFSITLSIIITSIEAPTVTLISDLACEEFKEQNESVEVIDCELPEIRIKASNYVMWYTTLSNIAVTISVGYISALSDYLGRKFVFQLSTVGMILAMINLIVVSHYWRILGVKFLYVGSIIQGLSGGVIAINTACHAYISDCTRIENRSVSFGLMHAFAYGGMAIGPVLGSIAVKPIGPTFWIFYIAPFTLIVFLLTVSLVVPESVSPDMRNLNYSAYSNYSVKSVLSPLTIFTQRPIEIDEENSWRGRNTLYILGAIYFIYKTSQAALNEIIILYTISRFKWEPFESGFFLTIQATTRSIALLVLLPLLRLIRSYYRSSYSRFLDIWTTRIGLTMEIIGFALFAIAIRPYWFYFACVINSLSTITTPAIRSLFTTYVLSTQAGQILGAIGVLESIGSILSPLWMNKLYNWGIRNDIDEIVFWANMGLFVVSFGLSTLIL